MSTANRSWKKTCIQHHIFFNWSIYCLSVLLPFACSARVLDVDVDNPLTGRASLVAIAKAVGVMSPLVSYDQVQT